MDVKLSFLIECQGCGIENLLSDFTHGKSAICNQCREALLNPDLVYSHKGHTCDDCSMTFILKNETKFSSGESECQCGSHDFGSFEIGPLIADLLAAEASFKDKGGEEIEEDDFDWCRSDPDGPLEGDYNNIFDDDPGFGR